VQSHTDTETHTHSLKDTPCDVSHLKEFRCRFQNQQTVTKLKRLAHTQESTNVTYE